jgi:hypothetical protein
VTNVSSNAAFPFSVLYEVGTHAGNSREREDSFGGTRNFVQGHHNSNLLAKSTFEKHHDFAKKLVAEK